MPVTVFDTFDVTWIDSLACAVPTASISTPICSTRATAVTTRVTLLAARPGPLAGRSAHAVKPIAATAARITVDGSDITDRQGCSVAFYSIWPPRGPI